MYRYSYDGAGNLVSTGRGMLPLPVISLGILPSDHVLQSARHAAGGTPGQLGSGVTYSGTSERTVGGLS